jgi:tetratricopeptide (TPR) repeat protein
LKVLSAILLALGGLAGYAGAQEDTLVHAEPAEAFLAGNQAYENGDYARAIRAYAALIDQGTASGMVHFNLGNAYLRNGELGSAIAELRRSHNLQPRDGDIQANLTFARQTTRDAIAPPEPSAVLSTLLFWHYGLSRSELAAALVLVNVLFWTLAALRLFFRESEILRWASIGAFAGLVLIGGSVAAHQFVPRPVAVIMPQEIDAYAAPDGEAVVRFKLHAGTEVLIRDERDGWLRIALPDQQQAWIERSWVEIVDG